MEGDYLTMTINDNYTEKFSIKSLFVYICKQYKLLFLAAIVGMVCLSALNLIKGQNYSDTVKETDVISPEELAQSREELAQAQRNLDASIEKLENQKALLQEYKDNLSEYEANWKADIYMQTSADNRYGVSAVYQLSGKDETSVDQTLNLINAAFNQLYDDIASKLTDANLTSYNVQRLFKAAVNLSQNQVALTVSFESQGGRDQIKELYHTWMNEKLQEYGAQYADAELELTLKEENEYIYYDTDIFAEQRSAADKKTSLQNNITNTSAAITSTQNEITNFEIRIEELKETLKKNEQLGSNTVVLSEDKLISKTSIIIYLILGVLAGIFFGVILCAFRYMYGTKLRDTDDMRCRTGENIIGTLYSPVYTKNSRLFRLLDRWNGVYEITDMDEQLKRLAMDIRIRLHKQHLSNFVLTGTAEETVIMDIRNQLSEYMEGISIYAGANPADHIETAQKLLSADVVVTVEKIGESRVSEIQKLRDYLNACHIQVLGGITV